MLNMIKNLCGLDGVSGNEGAVREFIAKEIRKCPDILETRTDALGNLLVLKKGTGTSGRTVLVGAHMDEVGLIVTEIRSDGRLSAAPVGGVEPDVVIGRYVRLENGLLGLTGTDPVHKLSAKERDKKPTEKDIVIDIGFADAEAAKKAVLPGTYAAFIGDFAELGGGRVTAKAIDDRFGCGVMLRLLQGQIPYDTWFGFFVQEEIGLRGSRTAAYGVHPDLALILEATTATDLDGVSGGDCVCRLGGGPVVSFMDRSTIYDRELYRLAFDRAQQLGIPCQTKTRIAGGNDAGAVHLTREGVRTLAISVPCRYLHSPSCTAQCSDMEQSFLLAEAMLREMHTV